MESYLNISESIKLTGEKMLRDAKVVHQDKWQGIKVPYRMFELFKHSFQVPIPSTTEELQLESKAHSPWAEDHFQERISGNPTNPGDTYKWWPFYVNKEREDKNFKEENDVFTHTYQERFWPKLAGEPRVVSGNIESEEISKKINLHPEYGFRYKFPHFGIRYEYGDFNDVVNLLAREPYTRQAYLPIWFPEDTGATHGGRIPCTLGYLFNLREGFLHVSYYIRSCDFIRHFKNDVYLTCRLVQHVLEMLREKDSFWNDVKPGFLYMDITSLHVFEHEKKQIEKLIKEY